MSCRIDHARTKLKSRFIRNFCSIHKAFTRNQLRERLQSIHSTIDRLSTDLYSWTLNTKSICLVRLKCQRQVICYETRGTPKSVTLLQNLR